MQHKAKTEFNNHIYMYHMEGGRCVD